MQDNINKQFQEIQDKYWNLVNAAFDTQDAELKYQLYSWFVRSVTVSALDHNVDTRRMRALFNDVSKQVADYAFIKEYSYR